MLFYLAFSIGLLKRHWHEAKTFSSVWIAKGDHWYTAKRGTVAPFQQNDRLVAIDGDSTAEWLGPWKWYRRVQIGEKLRYDIERDGRKLSIETVIRARELNVLDSVIQFLKSFALLAMAALMGLMRPGFVTAQVGFWAGLISSYLFACAAVTPVSASLQGWERFIDLIPYQPLHFAVGYHFLSKFPAPVAESLPWRILRRVIYALAIWLWLPRSIWSICVDLGWEIPRSMILRPSWVLSFHDVTAPALFPLLYFIAGGAMLAVVFRNYRLIQDEVDRRRMRFGAAGAIPALVLALINGILGTISQLTGVAVDSQSLRYLGTVLVILAPLSLAYAVLKHRLMGIRFVIRRGVQYLLAKNVLRVILFLPLLLTGWEIVTQPNKTLADIIRQQSITFDIIIFCLAAFSLRYRKSMQEWIDRRFFRSVYSQEKILLELLDDVKSADSLQEISQMVASKIDAALHPKDLFIFYRKDATTEFTIGYPEDHRGNYALNLLRQREILDSLESGANTPVMISTMGDVVQPIDAPQHSLLVPLTGANQRLAGVLWLDEKKSEEPYTARDRDLLQAIAGQIAMAHENLNLREKLDEEVRVRINVIGRLDKEAVNLLKECPSCGSCYDRSIEHCTIDGAELTMNTPVERVIDKKFRLDRRIGVGGMGSVYEAADLRLGRKVAIKIMIGRLFGNRAALRRFEREARASARLRHPNIVTIHDFGPLQGEGAYLVMEYIAGDSWRNQINPPQGMSTANITSLFDQFGLAMIAAHEAGIVHRDLKPENLILTQTPESRFHLTVLDFGLAKVREIEMGEGNRSTITATGVVMGTLRYMSPEQLAGDEVDVRSDIYAMGLILVETLFGSFPTKLKELPVWIENKLQAQAERNPGWDYHPLQDVLTKVLARNLTERYQTVTEFHADILRVLKDCPDFVTDSVEVPPTR